MPTRSLTGSTGSSPTIPFSQIIDSAQMMLFPTMPVLPQTTELPHREPSLSILASQTIDPSQTTESLHTTLAPQTSVACPVVLSYTAVGEVALPFATSVLPRAESTSRYPAPMVKMSYCDRNSSPVISKAKLVVGYPFQAVFIIRALIVSGVRVGSCWIMSAAAPATTGVAMLVPLKRKYCPPGPVGQDPRPSHVGSGRIFALE